jgi:hypothetical protein
MHLRTLPAGPDDKQGYQHFCAFKLHKKKLKNKINK